MSTGPLRLPTPPGVSVPGSRGDAAPDSVLGQLRADARRKREAQVVTVALPEHLFSIPLRARYGALPPEELERLADRAQLGQMNLTVNLEMLARACRAIEAYDAAEDRWLVLEDDIGPVTWDDRLPALLGMPRPDDEFKFSVRDVFDAIFSEGDPPEPNGFLITAHATEAMQGLGLVSQDVMPGESTNGSRTRSAPRPRSE